MVPTNFIDRVTALLVFNSPFPNDDENLQKLRTMRSNFVRKYQPQVLSTLAYIGSFFALVVATIAGYELGWRSGIFMAQSRRLRPIVAAFKDQSLTEFLVDVPAMQPVRQALEALSLPGILTAGLAPYLIMGLAVYIAQKPSFAKVGIHACLGFALGIASSP